ncbi:MAG TPA: LysR family transcriptional regulator [Gammaproteobacteria bacterium]|nr:LysR family transcriptional regulator [Gammaproteobacteria bacterium]
MSKFEQIATFVSVIQEHGFAAAAKKQGISTSAVSRQIAKLEASLGIQLLVRTPRRIALTEAGKQYFQYCKNALHEITKAETAIAGSQSEAVGILNVMGNRFYIEEFFFPRLAEFMQQNPKLKIRFELAERFPDLEEENVDIIFGTSLEGPPSLVRRRVATTRYVLCASPEYLKKYGTPAKPADLVNHRYITHAVRKPDIIQFKNNEELYLEPILWLNDSHTMLECAIQGIGIIKVLENIAEEALREKLLVEILQEYNDSQRTIYLYYLPNRYLQPKIRRFIDFYTESK